MLTTRSYRSSQIGIRASDHFKTTNITTGFLLRFVSILIIGFMIASGSLKAQESSSYSGNDNNINSSGEITNLNQGKTGAGNDQFNNDKNPASGTGQENVQIQNFENLEKVARIKSWSFADNPNPAINFPIQGTPVFAGDVNNDSTNDYLYFDGQARDERTENLSDITGKTALYFGGTPAKEPDQLLYSALQPAGNLNGDDYDDAIQINPQEETIRFFTGGENGYEAVEDFSLDMIFPGTGRVSGFVDLDDDGYEDVVLFNSSVNAFAVIYGAEQMEQVEQRVYEPQLQNITNGFFFSNAADLNEDGKGSVVRLAGSGQSGPTYELQVLEITENRELSEIQNFSITGFNQLLFLTQISLVDMNGNGRKELMANSRSSDSSYVFPAASEANQFQESYVAMDKGNAVSAGDMDSDGNHDFFTYEDSTDTPYLSYGPDDISEGLTFDTEISFADSISGQMRYRAHSGFGDVTGDGNSDIILSYDNRIDNTTGRRFFSVSDNRTAQSPVDIKYPIKRFRDVVYETNDIGDFNDDGVADLLMLRENSRAKAQVFYGGSSMSDTPDLSLGIENAGLNLASTISGDFNGDGVSDVAIPSGFGSRVQIYFGGSNPDSNVDHVIPADNKELGQINLIHNVGDVNDNGADELLAAELGGESNEKLALYSGGSAISESPDHIIEYEGRSQSGISATSPGDVNGDGVEDFVIGRPSYSDSLNSRGRADVYFGAQELNLQQPDLTLRPDSVNNSVGAFAYSLTGGDFNGDGDADVAVRPHNVVPGDGDSASVNNTISIFHGGAQVDDSVDKKLFIPATSNSDFDIDLDGYTNIASGIIKKMGPKEGSDSDRLVQVFEDRRNALLYEPANSVEPVRQFEVPNKNLGLINSFINTVAIGDMNNNGQQNVVFTQTHDNNEAAASSRVYMYEPGTTVSIEQEGARSDGFELSQNYPNPFNPETRIEYSVPKSAKIQLDVYNMLGRRVATLVNETKSAGTYGVNFNADNLASGIYIYRLKAGNKVITRKMSLIK